MKRAIKKNDDLSSTFFLQVMHHWATPGVVGAVVGLSLFLLCSGPWGIALGVGALSTGLMFSAVRWFGTATASDTKIQTEPIFAPCSDLIPDPLERFLCLFYNVTPELLQSRSLEVAIDSDSPLIACITKIKSTGTWGTELHVHYLSKLFNVKYALVDTFNKSIKSVGPASELNLRVLSAQAQNDIKAVQLINQNNVHWLTLVGDGPLAGKEDSRQYFNNPGGGDCLFYAFSFGLAQYMCKDISMAHDLQNSELFQRWCQYDPEMKHEICVTNFYKLGVSEDPLRDDSLRPAWAFFQRSLRHLVANYFLDQLREEGRQVLEHYQNIQTTSEHKDQILGCLLEVSPLYREFNMLYNVDKRAGAADLATNIFSDLYSRSSSMTYTV